MIYLNKFAAVSIVFDEFDVNIDTVWFWIPTISHLENDQNKSFPKHSIRWVVCWRNDNGFNNGNSIFEYFIVIIAGARDVFLRELINELIISKEINML